MLRSLFGKKPRIVPSPTTPSGSRSRTPNSPRTPNTPQAQLTAHAHNAYKATSRDKYIYYLDKFINSQKKARDFILTKVPANHANARFVNKLVRATTAQRNALRGVWHTSPMRVGPSNKLVYAPNVRKQINAIGQRTYVQGGRVAQLLDTPAHAMSASERKWVLDVLEHITNKALANKPLTHSEQVILNASMRHMDDPEEHVPNHRVVKPALKRIVRGADMPVDTHIVNQTADLVHRRMQQGVSKPWEKEWLATYTKHIRKQRSR